MIAILQDIPLSDRTSFKIGGPAKFFVEPHDEDEIREAVEFARDKSLPILLLGRGSNLLVSDAGWEGLAIGIGQSYAAVSWNGDTASAQAGVMLDSLVLESVRRGYAGLEELSGIPGSLGGALVMNAGAYGTTISEVVERVSYFDIDKAIIADAPREELGFGYRSSLLQRKNAVVLGAVLKFQPGNRNRILEVRGEVLTKRKTRQPLHLPNCGSVFKRPPGQFAGLLIEKAGLKGYRFGNAGIAEQHANFIVNFGGARADEVRHLIVIAQQRVFERSGVLLEPEVIFAGSFNEPLFHP
jgi:UDP-N-acetylmuramate dehydrogenase